MSFVKARWTSDDYAGLMAHLASPGDDSLKSFNNKIIPDAIDTIGIRIPILRSLAKELQAR